MTTRPKARVWDGVVKPFIPTEQPACQGEPQPTTEGYGAENQAALDYQAAVCAACPVLVACASHAMNSEPYGLWGLTEKQRWHLGGVVPEEWANIAPNPDKALDELEASRLALDIVEQIITVTGPRNQPAFLALAARTQATADHGQRITELAA